ncbi:MFS transporter [Mucilaginibacter phyllosphaerae]|uniref:MFS family arabinose efflux permease n=1 Tax=Mucilaginibacter phyllosphaerae TaxID=1812349 RepID=A0A4Y8AC02_9SPHI|nr:MFS transporter [Mucilaginibacter phyllosphaerae]MBB3969141.1 putative MFS family arabinose efflux permease [Mucilaginibacter phyllosphaerae]TEW66047.1 MFS transporter [Mucilaginibacter phyllosphaerae]GGH06580.1 MFS transporter [Mucilaginibacter phyllosphaerae]
MSLIQLYKKAYSGLSPNSWYLSVVMFINRSGTMVVPFMSIYCINQLGFSVVQAGYIMALFGVGAIFGAFIGGKLTDKIGFYDLQVFTLLSGGILFIILGYQRTFLSLAIGTFVLSFCSEAFRPANSTAIAHYSSPENKTRSYSLNRLAVNLGWAFGGGLGGYLASINYSLLFWVDGCTNILAALMLLKLMPRAAIKKSEVKPVATGPVASAYQDKTYLWFIFLSTIFGLCFFQFFIMEPVFYKIGWHLDERVIGALLALNGILIVLIEMVLINYLEGKRHALTYIVWGVLITGFAFALLNVLPPGIATATLVVILVTFGEIMSMPFMNSFWIARTNNYNRGEYAALYTMSWSAAQVFAPALGSQVINYGGFNSLWWLLGILSALTAAGYYLLYQNNKTAVETVPAEEMVALPQQIP